MSLAYRFLVSVVLLSLPAYAGSSVTGIRNFYQVDDHVCRGAQPTTEGLKYLARRGVKTILDLRGAGSRSSQEQQAAIALGMRYINVPMSGLTPPPEAQISKVLAVLEDTASGPVFVHCRRGADRTGAVIAAYRIDFSHWDNARALREAMSDGMSIFQLPRQRYIRTFHPQTVAAKSSAGPEATVSTSDPPATVMLTPVAVR